MDQSPLTTIQREDEMRLAHATELKTIRQTLGRRTMEKRIEIAGIRDCYTPMLEALEQFEEGSPKSYAIPDTYLRLLNVETLLTDCRLHDDMVGLLKIGYDERDRVNTILRTGWMHVAVKQRECTALCPPPETVNPAFPGQVFMEVKGSHEYGQRVKRVMQEKVAEVIGRQRMRVLFKLLDRQDWIMNYGADTRFRFYPRNKTTWGFVDRKSGYATIPSEKVGHLYDLLPERVQKHIEKEFCIVPKLPERWELGDD